MKTILKDIKFVKKKLNLLMNHIESNGKTNTDVIFGSMLNKIINTSTSIECLLKTGLQSDARALMRNILEATLKLISLSKDKNYYDLFIKNHEQVRLDYCKHVLRYKEIMSKEVVTEANSKMATFDLQKIKNNTKDYNKYKNYKLADIAEFVEIYAYSYIIFCSDVHTDLISVKDNLIINGTSVQINKGKKYENTNIYYETLLTILIKTLIEIGRYYKFDIDDLENKIKTKINWVKSLLSNS